MEKVTIEKLQKVAEAAQSEDVREWAAYRRDIRRRRDETMAVVVVTVCGLFFLVVVAWSFVAAARRHAVERAEHLELMQGGLK
jgi:hypothetical protein